MPKLTKRTVDAAQPDASRRYFLWDDSLRGFGLLLLPTGIRSFVYQYRTKDGQSRRATLGKYGSLTPDEARAKADEMRRAVAHGGDPLGDKQERRKAATVAEVLDSYLSSEAFANKAPKTQAIDKGRIDRHLTPLLGKARVETLRPGDIEKAFAAIRDGKTARPATKVGYRALSRVRGGEGAARKSIRLLRTCFAWAVREGLITANPAEHVKTGADGSRDTILDDGDSYRRLFETLDRMEAEKRLRPALADAIRVIALTGSRRGEIAGLRWAHVDLKRGLLTLPAASHKTGKSTGKPRVIGLPAVAQVIISRQPEGQPDDFVFQPAKGAGGEIQLSKMWPRVAREAGLPEGIGLHGLRHSLASHMAMNGHEAGSIMAVMGHRNLSTSQRYIHFARSAQQAVAEKAASVALAGMAASTGKAQADMLPLKGGASK